MRKAKGTDPICQEVESLLTAQSIREEGLDFLYSTSVIHRSWKGGIRNIKIIARCMAQSGKRTMEPIGNGVIPKNTSPQEGVLAAGARRVLWTQQVQEVLHCILPLQAKNKGWG